MDDRNLTGLKMSIAIMGITLGMRIANPSKKPSRHPKALLSLRAAVHVEDLNWDLAKHALSHPSGEGFAVPGRPGGSPGPQL